MAKKKEKTIKANCILCFKCKQPLFLMYDKDWKIYLACLHCNDIVQTFDNLQLTKEQRKQQKELR